MRERGGLEREAAGGRREVFRCPRVRVGRLKLDGERLAGGCRSNDVEEDEGEGAASPHGRGEGELVASRRVGWALVRAGSSTIARPRRGVFRVLVSRAVFWLKDFFFLANVVCASALALAGRGCCR